MIDIPATAAGLLAALNAAETTPEPAPAAPPAELSPSSWLDFSDAPAGAPDAYHLGGYEVAAEPRTYSATEAAALARRAVEAAERARLLARPVVLPPDVSRHIIVERRAEPWWLLLAAAGAVCIGVGSLTGALISAVGALIAWLMTRGE